MDNYLNNESPLYEKDLVSDCSTNLKSLFLFMHSLVMLACILMRTF
jgi:hypothetical protein